MNQFQHEVADEEKQMDENNEINVYSILANIQKGLHAPKNKNNDFGGFNYRNAEDILQAAKPLLSGAVILLNDEIGEIGGRFYLKATASIEYKGHSIKATAYAREAETKKGMDVAQVTGSTSSYARKYALNGLFAIDNTKDPDSMDNRQPKSQPKPKQLDIPKNVLDAAKYMGEALEQADYPVVYEHYMSIPNEFQPAIWSRFGSKERATMKKEFNKIKNGE